MKLDACVYMYMNPKVYKMEKYIQYGECIHTQKFAKYLSH